MSKSWVILFFLIGMCFSLRGQILPKENSRLNYRLVGFSFPEKRLNKGDTYKIEIAKGKYTDVESFEKNVIKTINSKRNKIIIEVPNFGCDYTWMVKGPEEMSKEQNRTLYHFSTMAARSVDTSIVRLRIIKQAKKYKDAFVFLDGNRTLYNMKGEPVWFLPKLDSLDDETQLVSDLKVTNQHTITLITAMGNVYEVNYNGDILWGKKVNEAKPKDDRYHHEFTRLANGHYMILSTEFMYYKMDSDKRKPVFVSPGKNPSSFSAVNFDKIIECDETGKIVWSFDPSDYYKDFWLNNISNPDNVYNDVHANAFYLDEKTRNLYVSFKNTSQIIKATYPDKKIRNVYGSYDTDVNSRIFCMQHACRISKGGNLYLFNNNACKGQNPSVVIMKEPSTKTGDLRKVWEYIYPADKEYSVLGKKTKTSGGNAIELPDGSFFVSLCSPYGNVLIVNMEKQVIWCAVLERWEEMNKEWDSSSQYRASIIRDNKTIEQLIWNTQAK